MSAVGRWDSVKGKNVKLDTTNFDNALSGTDVNVQLALDTLDNAVGAGGHDHTHIISGSAIATITADGLDITDGTDICSINFSSGDLKILNDHDGGTLTLAGQIATDTEKTLAVFSPAGAAELYYAGSVQLKTAASGIQTDYISSLTADTDLVLSALGTGVIDINDNWNAAGQTCSDLGSITTCDINGGTIDGVTINATSIGAGTPGTIVGSSITATGNVISQGGNVISGVSDSVRGELIAYGDSANDGGGVTLYTGATSDTDINNFQIDVNEDDLLIGPNTNTDAFKMVGNGSAVTVEFTVGLTGTTIDATTDFTVGGTVITDGVITDNTGFQITGGTITLSGSGETLAIFTDNGSCSFYHDNTKILETTATGISITDGTATAATIGFDSDDLVIQNNDHDGMIHLKGYTTGGVLREMVEFDPDGAMRFSIAGNETFTIGAGAFTHRDSNGTNYAIVTHTGTNYQIRNYYHGGDFIIQTENGGGSLVQWTFDSSIEGIVLPDAGKIVLDSDPVSDHTATGEEIRGETVDQNSYGAMGLLVLSSDGNWDDADADAEATVGKLALALESGTGSKRLLLRGIARDDTWSFTPGAQLYVDTTAGTITETRPSGSGDFVQVVGWAKTATIIFFEPSPDYAEV